MTDPVGGGDVVHAFTHRLDAGGVLAQAAGPGSEAARFDDVGLLAASMAFTLGAGTVEGVEHLPLAQAGALCALARMPTLSTLLARLGDPADRCGPLGPSAGVRHRDSHRGPCHVGVSRARVARATGNHGGRAVSGPAFTT